MREPALRHPPRARPANWGSKHPGPVLERHLSQAKKEASSQRSSGDGVAERVSIMSNGLAKVACIQPKPVRRCRLT